MDTATRHRAVSVAACAALVSPLAWGQAAVSPRLSATAETHATGVFLNPQGDVLTARHAVEHCRDILAVKDGRVVQARVRAISNERDLAVLGTDLVPYLSATFPERARAVEGSAGVFTEAYSVLQRMPQRGSVLSNALTVPGGEDLNLISGVKPGTSGSAVLRGDGLVAGVVVERVARWPGAATGMLSRASGGAVLQGPSQVRAISAEQVKAFLRDNGIAFTQSDVPQLAPNQSPAARAATLAVGILCG
ncbi:serine protease [Pigmentiphaga sp. H8]|uniref:S1 family peptidase n=1 Tax=Pigmentiphaga sp. H8 TaxID=2488560 RepID=UPI0013757008|nr:serine protease [Pigmentiphaga sp. H8]